ncbi:hypothetical protein Unana1_06327 [Umbelopsis nana]
MTHFQQEFDVSAEIDASIAMGLPEARSETTGTPQSVPEEYQPAHTTTNKALDKATKAFVINWIQDNYEVASKQSVARNDAYEHYATFCESVNVRPINSALFGKLIRSVFPNMKTRRLGNRGASKYHYGGIKRKEGPETIRKEMMDLWYGLDSKFGRFLRDCNEIVEAIWRWDSALYDCIMANAISDVTATIPSIKTKALRQFAGQFESWVAESVKNFSADLNQIKVDVARIFVSKLRHRILLNHEAKLASQIIQDEDKMSELQMDWAAIDLAMVIDQNTWICECRADDVENIVVKDIVGLLYDGKRLDDWISWLTKLTSKLMLKTMDAGRFVHHARQIILKWNHYSSAIQKDFSLRSATSLATLMILKMFIDDYLVSLVEGHVAELNVRLARPTAPPVMNDEDEGHLGVSGGEGGGDHSRIPDYKSSRDENSRSPFHVVAHRFR